MGMLASYRPTAPTPLNVVVQVFDVSSGPWSYSYPVEEKKTELDDLA